MSTAEAAAAATLVVEAVVDREIAAEAPVACVERDAEVAFAVGQQGFQLWIAFEAARHALHRLLRCFAFGVVPLAIVTFAGPVELLPARHEVIGAGLIGAERRLHLQSADGPIDLARSCRAGQGRIFGIGRLGIVPAVGPHLLEGFARGGQISPVD